MDKFEARSVSPFVEFQAIANLVSKIISPQARALLFELETHNQRGMQLAQQVPTDESLLSAVRYNVARTEEELRRIGVNPRIKVAE